MPPKRSKTKRKPPKKKLTKAEKDKLKLEEDEAKRQEEEEQKLKSERENLERLDREKQEVEQRKILEAEEDIKRKTQLKELNEIIDTNEQIIKNREENKRKQAKWDRYMRCDGSADPTIAGEINTFINLQLEDKDHNSIADVMSLTAHTLSLISELEFILQDTPKEELTEQEVARYRQTLIELQNLISHKIDLASHDVTLKASALMNSETLNLQECYTNEQIKLYIWGNLSKNPRIKSFEFPDEKISFEIPKILTLSDCGVRCLFTKFDHLSHLSKSYLPRKKQKEEQVIAEEPAAEEEKGENEAEADEGEGEEKENAESQKQLAPEELVENLANRMENLMASLEKDNTEPDEEVEEEKENVATEEQQVEIIEDDLVKTPEPEEYEDFDGDEDAVDLRAYAPAGGIIHFNLFHMPPQSKTVKAWTITQMAEPPHLHYINYIADDVNPSVQLMKQKAQQQQEDDSTVKREERPPIMVQLKVPTDVFYFEDPIIARWDQKQQLWRQDGFQDINFVEESRRLTFKTCYFGTFTLMQDVHINMPFQSWEIRPRGVNHCVLTLIAAIVELEIEVKETQCCLKAPMDRSELNHIRGVWMPLCEFIQMLKSAGVNIFPNDDSSRYVTVQDKNAIAEMRLYQQMGLTASTMAYSWSKWNGDRKPEKIIFQGAPQLKDEPLTEDDWSLFMITRKRSMKLRMVEFDEDFTEDFAEGTEFHADMYHMALEISGVEGQKRIKETDYTFAHTVTNLLKSTRLIIYS